MALHTTVTRHRNASSISTETLCDLIRMIFTMNNFSFNDKHYLQTHGTAIWGKGWLLHTPHATITSHQGGGGGGRCLQGNLWYSPPASMTSRLASVTFKMANKVFIEETDKDFDLITEILFRFLGFGDFKVLLS